MCGFNATIILLSNNKNLQIETAFCSLDLYILLVVEQRYNLFWQNFKTAIFKKVYHDQYV
jgi:hypothetical protein